MSRRTAESNKAIKQAWLKEKKLILAGMGTRDWSPEQQEQIITSGKAYDENDKAIEGHHMKSVEAYPNFQGNSDNIEFLTRDEHRAAHAGNFRNSTNGKYNILTGETDKFAENELKKCETIQLSNPIINTKQSIEEKDVFSLNFVADTYKYSMTTEVNNSKKKIKTNPINEKARIHIGRKLGR